MFLAQALNEDPSCQKTVNDMAIKRIVGGLSVMTDSNFYYLSSGCQIYPQQLP